MTGLCPCVRVRTAPKWMNIRKFSSKLERIQNLISAIALRYRIRCDLSPALFRQCRPSINHAVNLRYSRISRSIGSMAATLSVFDSALGPPAMDKRMDADVSLENMVFGTVIYVASGLI